MIDQFNQEIASENSQGLSGQINAGMRAGNTERNEVVRAAIAKWCESVKQWGASVWLHAANS